VARRLRWHHQRRLGLVLWDLRERSEERVIDKSKGSAPAAEGKSRGGTLRSGTEDVGSGSERSANQLIGRAWGGWSGGRGRKRLMRYGGGKGLLAFDGGRK